MNGQTLTPIPQFGYFLDHKLWLNSIKLLEYQLSLKPKNKHFNTLSMFYYERLDKKQRKKVGEKPYFEKRVANNLFYGLEQEFSAFSYPIPKSNLGIRKYRFFTYPMRILHYSIGLYLLRLSQEFLQDYYKKCTKIWSSYGGQLRFDDATEELRLNYDSVWYKKHYVGFRNRIRKELETKLTNKVIIKLDIQNYFEDLSIPVLLNSLKRVLKSSIQKKFRFDAITISQISIFYDFLANGRTGIPQADNDLSSSFIGYLYLVFGDLFLDQKLSSLKDSLKDYSIIRYMDDIYLSIEFQKTIPRNQREAFVNLLAAAIADYFYQKLGLRLNTKTKLYWLYKKSDRRDLLNSLKKVSPGYDMPSEDKKIKPSRRAQSIIQRLAQLKGASPFDEQDDLSDEIFKEIYDSDVQNLLSKPTNLSRLRKIFTGFNFDLIVGQTREIVIIILLDKNIEKQFKEFLLKKQELTFRDCYFILTYLCQTNFRSSRLLNLLSFNEIMHKIMSVFNQRTLCMELPGYYDLSGKKTLRISGYGNVIDQIRLRIFAEQRRDYSVALNHLLNEIHAICYRLENSRIKESNYDANCAISFLEGSKVSHDIRIGVRNLFDRRNKNPVAHADKIAWPVDEAEYLEYRDHVGNCLKCIL